MKRRCDFVSNSSSSSFIVISASTPDMSINTLAGETVALPTTEYGACYEFGWQEERYSDIWSKLNFCALQCYYMHADDGLRAWDMLKDVCERKLGLSISLRTKDLDSGKLWAYIDHQSAAQEGANIEMFENSKALYHFLGFTSSYIQCDNDNH